MQDEMREQYSRTRLLLGQAGLDRLRAAFACMTRDSLPVTVSMASTT